MALFVMSIDELEVARVVRGPFTDPSECASHAEDYWSEVAEPGEEVLVVDDKHPLLSLVSKEN